MGQETRQEQEAKKIIAALEAALRMSTRIINDYQKHMTRALYDLTHRKN